MLVASKLRWQSATMPHPSASCTFFKNEARKALHTAHTAREQGNTKAADKALNRAAKARKALITQSVTIPLERELWDTIDEARRHALAAHLLNSQKAKPRAVLPIALPIWH